MKNKTIHESKKMAPFWGALIGLGVILVIFVILDSIKITDYRVYKDPSLGVEMKYPANWGVIERPGAGALVAFTSPKDREMDPFIENVNISVQDASGTLSDLDRFSRTAIRQLTATLDYQVEVLESKKIKVAGQPGYRFIYMGKEGLAGGDQSRMLKYMHVWTIHEGRGYIITYVAIADEFSKYWKYVKAMIRSFRFAK